MNSSPLSNYLRTYRKRAGLSQKELAFLLGNESAAEISRYEHGRQTPKLGKLLAYEYLFQTPIRKVYDGVSVEVEHEIRDRVRQLIKKLQPQCRDLLIARKIEILKSCLEPRTTGGGTG
jgi:transcriptional regulator with XRE-family HTH domain